MGKKSRSGFEIPDHISESLENFFGLKYLNSFMQIRIQNLVDPASGMEKFGFGFRDKHPGFATLYVGTISVIINHLDQFKL
jgi:hypothetical protein